MSTTVRRYPRTDSTGYAFRRSRAAIRSLDPFEEQLDLPAAAVQLRDAQRWQQRVIGEEDESTVVLNIEVLHSTQRLRIRPCGVPPTEHDRLIASQPAGFIDVMRLQS